MKQFLAAFLSALQGAAVGLLNMLFLAAPVIVFWVTAAQAGIGVQEIITVAAAAWLLGHTVPLSLPLGADSAFELGINADLQQIPLSLPPLGVLLLTVFLAIKLTAHRAQTYAGVRAVWAFIAIGSLLGFIIPGALAAKFATQFLATDFMWAVLKPALWYFAACAAALIWGSRRKIATSYTDFINRRAANEQLAVALLALRVAPRLAAAVFLGFIAVAASGLAVSTVLNFAEYVRVSESLHPDITGLLLLFLAQLLLLPVALIWALAWFSGSGFAVGAETVFSPFTVLVGSAPALPLTTLIPHQASNWGVLAPLTLTLAAAIIGYFASSALRLSSDTQKLAALLAASPLVAFAGGVLTSVAVGAIGAGKLTVTGADPITVGAALGGIAFIGLGLGLFIKRAPAAADNTTQPLWWRQKAAFMADRLHAPSRTRRMQQLSVLQRDTVQAGEGQPLAAAAETKSALGTDDYSQLHEFVPLSRAAAELNKPLELAETKKLLAQFAWHGVEADTGADTDTGIDCESVSKNNTGGNAARNSARNDSEKNYSADRANTDRANTDSANTDSANTDRDGTDNDTADKVSAGSYSLNSGRAKNGSSEGAKSDSIDSSKADQ